MVPAKVVGAENRWWIQRRGSIKDCCRPLLSVAQQVTSPTPVKCFVDKMGGSSKMKIFDDYLLT